MRKGWKWIAREVERLDPEVDYERIWALTNTYQVNAFVLNLLYAVGIAKVVIRPDAAATLTRPGGGVFLDGDRRHRTTIDTFLLWFERGPSDPATQRSVRQINRRHGAVARTMPGHFSHSGDYIYTLGLIGADAHRLRIRLGLPGYTVNQQIATHRYCRELCRLFRAERPAGAAADDALDKLMSVEITGFPDDFDGMLRQMAEYEAVDWPPSDHGRRITEALIDQFSRKWFPGPLRAVGRALVLSLIGEPFYRLYGLRPPPRPVRRFVEIGLRLVLLAQDRLLPDPRTSYGERRRARAGGAPASGCPVLRSQPADEAVVVK